MSQQGQLRVRVPTELPAEPDVEAEARRAFRLRAGVQGADNGIIAIAALLLGVAAAIAGRTTLVTVGVAGIVAGSLSLGIGEFVAASTRRDNERELLERERERLSRDPDRELRELTWFYAGKGMPLDLAAEVAVELTRHDALRSHADAELHVDPEAPVTPRVAAATSAGAFALGALLPFLALVVPPARIGVPLTFAVAVAALVAVGSVSARLGREGARRATVRIVLAGSLVMAVAYLVGMIVGAVV